MISKLALEPFEMGGWRYILLIVLACKGVDGGAFETRRAKDSRPALDPEVQGLVGIVAVFIILANSMLCLFIARDPGLWSYVSIARPRFQTNRFFDTKFPRE